MNRLVTRIISLVFTFLFFSCSNEDKGIIPAKQLASTNRERVEVFVRSLDREEATNIAIKFIDNDYYTNYNLSITEKNALVVALTNTMHGACNPISDYRNTFYKLADEYKARVTGRDLVSFSDVNYDDCIQQFRTFIVDYALPRTSVISIAKTSRRVHRNHTTGKGSSYYVTFRVEYDNYHFKDVTEIYHYYTDLAIASTPFGLPALYHFDGEKEYY